MKKTRKTILTAALLSTAVMMQNGINPTSGKTENHRSDKPADTSVTTENQLTQPVYGPPVTDVSEEEPEETTLVTTTEPAEISEPEYQQPLYGPPYVLMGGKGNLHHEDKKINIVDYIKMKNAIEEDTTDFIKINLGDLDEDGELTSTDLKMFERYLFGITNEITDPLKDPIYQTKYGCPPTPVSAELQPAYGVYPIIDPDVKPVTTAVTEKEPEKVTEFEKEPIQVVYGPPSYFGLDE